MILIIDNYDSFTYNLVQRIGELGYDLKVIRNDKVKIDYVKKLKPTHIIISPGPCTPNESGNSNKIIKYFAGKIPILGVCLGHQCIAHVFGGKIIRSSPVHGKEDLIYHDKKTIYHNIQQGFKGGRYHSLIVDKKTLPECLEITAWNELGIIMGLRHKDFKVEGVQFHPESIITDVGYKVLENFIGGNDMFVSINGELVKENDAKISVFDHGLLLGDGIFETLRTYNGKLFKFDEHYKRLKDSAKQIFMKVPVSKESLRKDIERVIKANSLKEARVRITLTRGIGPSGLSIDCKEQKLIIIANKLKKVLFDNGVKAVTYNLERNIETVKSLSYLPSVIAKENARKKGALEAILIDNDSYIREGSFSNVFIVKDNFLFTPKKKLLKGITRGIVIDIAKKSKINLIEKEIKKEELFDADEVFITFTTAGIVPVVNIDGKVKKIGRITKKLIRLYSKKVF